MLVFIHIFAKTAEYEKLAHALFAPGGMRLIRFARLRPGDGLRRAGEIHGADFCAS